MLYDVLTVGGDFFVIRVDKGFGFGSRQDSALGEERESFYGEVVAAGFVTEVEVERGSGRAVLHIAVNIEVSSRSIFGRVLMIEEHLL